MIRRLLPVLVLLLPGSGHVLADAVDERVVVVHAGQLLDRPGQPPRGASTLLIRGERIAEVRDGHLDAAAFGIEWAEVIDLGQQFVLPGLIDTHVHLTSDLGGVAAQVAAVERSQSDVAYEAALNAQKTLAAGFTTVRNLGDRDQFDWRHLELIR
ncbi:MAG TPA: amidohydrolase family protein, partial [Xanthomonadaceae bacterium]|nr:amidohydrolase family protein [Xanthomonadaceae bacterium]